MNELPIPAALEDVLIQPAISGYRQLSREEATLINRIKALGLDIQAMTAEVNAHVASQREFAAAASERNRLDAAEPERWLSIARTYLQLGQMALTRAVAQPGGF